MKVHWIVTLLLEVFLFIDRISVNPTLLFPSCRMGSRSPPNSSQPPAFFSKLTENTSAIVKSKKQEMIKKMTVVGTESGQLVSLYYFSFAQAAPFELFAFPMIQHTSRFAYVHTN